MVDNATIARILVEMADVCEIRGDNVFKVRAFRNAAAAVETLPYEVGALSAEPERLLEIKGIGAGIARKILEICATGDCEEHLRLLAEFPPALLEMLQVQGVGPKKVRLFHAELGVRSIADLEEAARAGRVAGLPRMSAGTERKLLQSIEEHRSRTGRFLLPWADQAADRLLDMLRALPGVRRAELAGSLRRRRETVGDLDLLVTCEAPAGVMDHFSRAGTLIARGETKASIRLSSGIQVDLRIVPEQSFGAALHYFTGSKSHNVAVRTLGVRRGLTINEYGVFEALPEGSPGRRRGGSREEEVFEAVGLPFIPPELREDRGEIEAALQGRLPRLLELGDIKGDVHMHTSTTDGTATIEQMALAAAERGRRYIAITDHSRALAMARGLDESALRAHTAEIAQIRKSLGDRIHIFSGIEVDILQDGSLDLDRAALAEVDIVIGSVHSYFQLSKEEMTRRVVRAIESGAIDILGHPTGRILLRRDPYGLDMEAVMRAASHHGVALEASATPDRLDLSDHHCRMAKEHRVRVVINTDAHATGHLDFMRFGVSTARRGWLEATDVLNTRDAAEFLRALHEGHR